MDPSLKVEGEKLREKLRLCREEIEKVKGEQDFVKFKRSIEELEGKVDRLKMTVDIFLKWKEAEEKTYYLTLSLSGGW